MSALTLKLAKGTSRDFTLQVLRPDGTPVNDFVSTDMLTAKVWPGGQQGTLFNPPATWIDPSIAKYKISFNNADTATWVTQDYRLQVYATRDGRTFTLGDPEGMTLSLIDSPGLALALPVYCTYNDMLKYAPWLSRLAAELEDESGFAEQRNLARTWLENVIQRHYRDTGGLNLQIFGNPVPTWGPQRHGGYSKWLQDQLNAGYLMTGPPRRVAEMTAKYAIGLVLQRQLAGGTTPNVYESRAKAFFFAADSLVKGYTAELDINGDGYPEQTVECGLIDALRGG